MEHFEIEESKEPDERLPLDPSTLKRLPLGPLSRGIKPSVFKRRTQMAVLAFPIIFFIISCLFSGFQVYWTYAFNRDHPYTDLTQILYRLQHMNCGSPMITDIKIVPPGEDCDLTYKNNEDVGVWNGTIPGCFNPDSKIITPAACPLQDVGNNINERPPTTLYVWNGVKFCTQTLPSYFVMSTEYGQNREGFRICAAEPRPFYVGASQDCPISDIQIVTSDAKIPKGYKQRKLYDDKILIFNNDPTSIRKLVDLNTELTTSPCFNPGVSPTRQSHDPYPLSRKKEVGCGEYGHDSEGTVILDMIDPLVLYKQNGLEQTQKDLPLWQSWHKNEQIVLFAKFRDGIQPRPECNFCNPGSSLVMSAKELTVSGKYLNLYVILTGVVLTFQFFLIIYNIVQYFSFGTHYAALLDKVTLINSLFYAFNLCYFTMHGIFAYWDYRELKSTTDRLKLIEELDCFRSKNLNKLFDDLRGKVLDNSRDIIQDCFKAEIIAVIFSIAVIFANYVNKALVKRDRRLMAADIAKHVQISVPRGEYQPQAIGEAENESRIESENAEEKNLSQEQEEQQQ